MQWSMMEGALITLNQSPLVFPLSFSLYVCVCVSAPYTEEGEKKRKEEGQTSKQTKLDYTMQQTTTCQERSAVSAKEYA